MRVIFVLLAWLCLLLVVNADTCDLPEDYPQEVPCPNSTEIRDRNGDCYNPNDPIDFE